MLDPYVDVPLPPEVLALFPEGTSEILRVFRGEWVGTGSIRHPVLTLKSPLLVPPDVLPATFMEEACDHAWKTVGPSGQGPFPGHITPPCRHGRVYATMDFPPDAILPAVVAFARRGVFAEDVRL